MSMATGHTDEYALRAKMRLAADYLDEAVADLTVEKVSHALYSVRAAIRVLGWEPAEYATCVDCHKVYDGAGLMCDVCLATKAPTGLPQW